MSINKVILIGRLGNDPEVKTLASGVVVCNLRMATSTKIKEEVRTEWHDVVVFGKQAETCGKYLKKGENTYVEGRISYRKVEKDGVARNYTDVVAEKVNFIGTGKES